LVGSGLGLRRGILIKRASALEAVARLDALLLDKTGTLTRGRFEVTGVVPVGSAHAADVLALAAAAESNSTHPLARAVTDYALRTTHQGSGLSATDVVERGGFGLTCVVGGKRVAVGNQRLMAEVGVDAVSDGAQALSQAGKSLMYVAVDGQLMGLIALADAPKPNAAAAVAQLKALGLKLSLITGDGRRVAEAVGKAVGIDDIRAEVLPGDKRNVVKELQDAGLRVGMVGDGINDAPALAQADVGLAIGSGTDVAKETGDLVLVRDDLMDVVRAIRLGRATLRKIKQNLFWAFFYNLAAIPIAAGVLYPAFGLALRPELAGLAMSLSSVSVVTNSLLLRRTNITE
ncbi:MAG: heavy metal translocating P-type ATPase, partial [Planctomycetes bacterium]|nr:heavy metal translocating P-type ATPase [Planctomycetota bacterium]